MGLRLITGPTVEPLTLADMRVQCRLEPGDTDNDAMLTVAIAAARAKAESVTRSAVMPQTWDLTLDAFPSNEIKLARPPVTQIVSVKYLDADGATQTLDSSKYVLDDATFPGWVLPTYGNAWPSTRAVGNAVAVRMTCGYANAAAVPGDLRLWLLMTAAFIFEHREIMVVDGKVGELPNNFAQHLLDTYTVFEF